MGEKLISLLHELCTTIWNERCTIVQVANVHTGEIRYRQKAKEFCNTTRKQYWKLMYDSVHQLDRDDSFFLTAPLINIQTWYDNLLTAIERSNQKHKLTLQDIREFFTRDEKTKGMKKIVKKNQKLAEEGVGLVTRTFQQKKIKFSGSRFSSLGK